MASSVDRRDSVSADSRARAFSAAELETLSRGLEIVASRRLSDPEDAREAVQETLARTIEAIREDRVPPGAPLGAFAYGIHRHVVADLLRDRYRKPTEPVYVEGLPALDPSPLERLISSEERRRVARAVARLSPPEQELLRSCFVEGRKMADIARELGVPSARLRKRKSRALERLRGILGRRPGSVGGHDQALSPTTRA